MRQHTQGPWHQHTTEGKTYASVRGANGQIVADCGSRSDELAQANARLIAAAPELLAALRGTLQALEAHLDEETKRHGLKCRDELCPCNSDEVKKARAAIAKAI